jgi:hypothetical protein
MLEQRPPLVVSVQPSGHDARDDVSRPKCSVRTGPLPVDPHVTGDVPLSAESRQDRVVGVLLAS